MCPNPPPIPCFFALLIGIDFYDSKDFPRLRGAVRDAFSYKEFLTERLNIPENQIRMLIDKQASRVGILEAFKAIKEDPRIRKGDPIFIVFAGHGCEDEPPAGWQAGGSNSKIQMLVPQDYSSWPGSVVEGIPDRVIGSLLEDIAEVKGKNITVVFDCCNSSSGTRGRNKELTIQTKDLDRVICDKRAEITSKLPFRGSASHILISACRSSERARDLGRGGSFSTAFLKLLRSVSPDKLRYCDILTKMDRIFGQNPQIEGFDLDRYLFEAKVHSPSSPSFTLRHDDNLNSIVINAGAAHGVTQGTEFLISHWETQGTDVGTILGTLVVERAESFFSTIQSDPKLPILLPSICQTTTAIQTKAGRRESLCLYIPPGIHCQASCKRLLSLFRDLRYDLHNIALVNEPHHAHLEITFEHNKANIRLLCEKITHYGLCPRLPPLDAHDNVITPFLGSVSRYFWELDRTSDDTELMDKIEVLFQELEESRSPFQDIQRPEMSPTGPNLYQDKKVDIFVKDAQFYGIKLTNNSSRDLYLNLLYFDSTDFPNITTLYKPPFSGPYLPDSPLKKGGSLTLGYGFGGMAPLCYSLRGDQDIAVGFLKLFISTQPLDSYPLSMAHHTLPDRWSTLVIPILQRRRSITTPPIRLANVWPQRMIRGRTTSLPGRPGFGRGSDGFLVLSSPGAGKQLLRAPAAHDSTSSEE